MTTPNPMDRLIALMSSAVSAGAEDALRLTSALREGRIDVDDVQRWYDQRRDQGMDLIKQIGDELAAVRQQGVGRFITSSKSAISKRASAARRAASRSRRRNVVRRTSASRRDSSSSSSRPSRATSSRTRSSGAVGRASASMRRSHVQARGRMRSKAGARR